MALPLAVLLASLMTMGNLGENYELTAMKASGISLPRIVAPLVIISFTLTIFAILFSNYINPIANKKMGSLLWDITRSKPELQIKEGVFYNGLENYSIYIGKRDYKTNLLNQIKIYDHSDGRGNVKVTVADSGRMELTENKKFLFITLYNGYNYTEGQQQTIRRFENQTYPFQRDRYAKQVIRVPMVGFGLKRTDESLFNSQKMLSFRQLDRVIDSLRNALSIEINNLYQTTRNSNLMRYRPTYRQVSNPLPSDSIKPESFARAFDSLSVSQRSTIINEALNSARTSKSVVSNYALINDEKEFRIHKYEIEWWRKYTLSAGCLIFFFIGAPLGAIIRKGGLGMPVVISVLFFVLYYIISLTGEKFAREGIMSVPMGMWLSAIVLLPTGIFLTRKATRDSSLFNIEVYTNFFKKIFSFLNKINPVKSSEPVFKSSDEK